MANEAKLQADCFKWVWNKIPAIRGLVFHVANGEQRDKRTANKLKAMGVVAGVADIVFLFHSRAHFYEFKDKGGRQSKPQERWSLTVRTHGFRYVLIDNLEDFQTDILLTIKMTLMASKDFRTWADIEEVYNRNVRLRDVVNYRFKIFDYLCNKVEVGQSIEIDKICTTEKAKEKFIREVKIIYNMQWNLVYGFDLTFSDDYTLLHKADASFLIEKIKGESSDLIP